ncbi:MAG: hypothetical protein ACLQNE_08115 [Thermoguttaceae bacterium]
MDQLIPSLLVLLDPYVTVFRREVFDMFRLTVGAWIVCLGRRTIRGKMGVVTGVLGYFSLSRGIKATR